MAHRASPFDRYKALTGGDIFSHKKSAEHSSPANQHTSAGAVSKQHAQETQVGHDTTRFSNPSSTWPSSPHNSTDWYSKQSSELATHNNDSASAMPNPSSARTGIVSGPSSDLFQLNERVGEVAPTDIRFCPILALSKFPYKFLGRSNQNSQQAIATAFFDQGKFWGRTWNL